MPARLREDAGALRDAEHLPGGGETSPAGRVHRLFRLYASLPARVDAAVRVAELLGLREPIDAGTELFAFVVADLALASRLTWARPIPLLAVAILHPSLRRGAGAGAR